MLNEDLIVPSHSLFSSPVLLVRKMMEFGVFVQIIELSMPSTFEIKFPIPTIGELLDELHGAIIFSKIDLQLGYHQIRKVPEDTHKKTFCTYDRHYEFLVMLFGLTNASVTFLVALDDLLPPYLRRFVLVFFDDTLIYITNISYHLQHLAGIFNLLQDHKFFAKLVKCIFAVA